MVFLRYPSRGNEKSRRSGHFVEAIVSADSRGTIASFIHTL